MQLAEAQRLGGGPAAAHAALDQPAAGPLKRADPQQWVGGRAMARHHAALEGGAATLFDGRHVLHLQQPFGQCDLSETDLS